MILAIFKQGIFAVLACRFKETTSIFHALADPANHIKNCLVASLLTGYSDYPRKY